MKSYKFMVINYVPQAAGVTGINLYCTDPDEIYWIYEEIKKLVPSADTRRGREDIEGEMHFTQFYKLKGKDYEITHWLFRRACENGWMPLDATTMEIKSFYKLDNITFKLRKEEEIGETTTTP